MDVVFANLPFSQIFQPSLAFSLFKPILQKQGYSCSVLYPNLQFANDIGRDLYSNIANYYPQTDFLLGELLFSQFLNSVDLAPHFCALSDLVRSSHTNKFARF